MAKSYEELRFTDDFMFGKVMEDRELCRDVLECLLGEKVGELREVQTERQFRYTADGKPIRLDVYTRDERSVYDAEMQNLNHRRAEKLELAKRSRFYQSMMDADYLQKGNSYRELPEGKVLFICTFDPFSEDRAVYTFESRCEENRELPLRDGTVRIFYNCACEPEKVPEGLRELYAFLRTGEGRSVLTKKIENAVERARRNEKWRSEYMKELLHDDDMREEGREEGLERGREEGLERGREEGLERGRAEGLEEGIKGFILDKLEDGVEKEIILDKLKRVYGLSQDEAEKYIKMF